MSSGSNVPPALGLPDDISFDPKFPPLPRTLAEVTRLLEKGESASISALQEIVSADPVVAPLVLRRINSAYYGLRRYISRVDKAIVLLGFDEIYDIVETASLIKLKDLFYTDECIEIFQNLMRESIMTAAFSRKLARHLDLQRQRFAYTAGLLHSLGELILLYNVPDSYEALWWNDNGLCRPTVEEEQSIYGADYTHIGTTAARKWNFPDLHVTLIRYHATPEQLSDDPHLYPLALTVHAAKTTMAQLMFQRDLGANPTSQLPYSTSLEKLTDMHDAELPEVQEYLEGEKADIRDYTDMVMQF